jgi:ABC-type uncharacterized transport system permease subunit
VSQLASIALFVALVAYSGAATLFFVDLARRDEVPAATRWGSALLGVGIAGHGLQIVLTSLVTHICPIASLPFGLSLAGFATATCYLLLRTRWNINAMGVAIVPIALTFLVGAQFVGQGLSSSGISRGWLVVHIGSELMGLALVLFAGAAGGFYVIQERRLKAKQQPSRLPALDALDRAEHHLLLAAFPLQTIGAVSGAAFISRIEISDGQWITAALAYTTWLLIAVVLLLRSALGWKGRRPAYGAILGAACVMLVLFIYVFRASYNA